MSIPLDDRHPIERERIAQLGELVAQIERVTGKSPGRLFLARDVLLDEGYDEAQVAAFESVLAKTTSATLIRAAAGASARQQVCTAVLGALLFGIRLAKKGLV